MPHRPISHSEDHGFKPNAARRWSALVGMLGAMCLSSIALAAQEPAEAPALNHQQAWGKEFNLLENQIRLLGPKQEAYPRLERETLHRQALILASDKTPVDVILRRTQALLGHLQAKKVELPGEDLKLKSLAALNKDELDPSEQLTLFRQIARLRRSIAFKNPLLDFDDILFIKHNRIVRGHRHMIDQYLGFNQQAMGGVYRLNQAFSDQPKVESVLDGKQVAAGRLKGHRLEDKGSFISLDLHPDGNSILFAFTEAQHELTQGANWSGQHDWEFEKQHTNKSTAHYLWQPENTFHVFKTALDGGAVEQLTDEKFNDYDPVFLPSGRIAFISDRIQVNCRCGARWAPTATLHSMAADGSDVIQLSYHETNEWHPSVNHDGMLAYTRWDYVDRDSDCAHHLWTCFPDGRDPRSQHGNYPRKRELRPWLELAIRAIPGSQKYMAVSAPHHGENYGSVIQIDPNIPDDREMSQVKRLTPDVLLPESETSPGIPKSRIGYPVRAEVVGQPWPLDEHFYLAVYADHDLFRLHRKLAVKANAATIPKGDDKYGIYLMDVFGNRIFLYRDSAISCLDPIPLQARSMPPVIPSATQQTQEDLAGKPTPSHGTVAIMNSYLSDTDWPEGTRIKQLRIVNIFGKSNAVLDKPNIGAGHQSLARGVIGTVPVEEDGSAYFKVPAGMSFYMQALDEEGKMVQNMRSATYVHPGETLSCMGCHESKHSSPAPPMFAPIALRRAPSEPTRGPIGSYPILFPRLVQPILDRKCVDCHEKEDALVLAGNRFDPKTGRSLAFESLKKYSWFMTGGNGAIAENGRSYSVPGKDGARVSKLYKILKEGHHKVTLNKEEWEGIITWLDCNSNYYGSYKQAELQTKGEVVAPLRGLPPGVPFEKLKR